MKRRESGKPGASQAVQSEPSLEEGMYYEKVFGPEKVKVDFNDKGELQKLVFEDKNGQTLEVAEERLVSRCLMYFAKYTDFGNVAELRKLAPNLLEQALNTAIPKRNKDLKAMYDKEGKLQGIASTMHEQISWQKIKQIIEGTVQKLTGKVIQPENHEHPFKWSYQVPAGDKNVSTWVGVHAGNNIIKGKSGVKIFSRFRTEREGMRGGIKQPACHNWCGMWQFPEQFFKVPLKGLDSIINYVGKENVKDIELLQFHLRPDLKGFEQELSGKIANMIKSMEKITPVINQSVHSALNRNEMKNILWAYQAKSKSYLPDYIVEQILKHVEDETIWGFSQAVSWVRTHGEFKFVTSTNAMFKDVEDRDLTWRLENIAGEVLGLTPTIIDIHKQRGEITLDFLVGEEAAKQICEAQKQKEEKLALKVKV